MSAGAPEQPGGIFDERDYFISWLRGEFVAANAIIDHLVTHLCSVGDPGEYDHVCAAVQHRRHLWTPIIDMQEFFPVSHISDALQQSRLRRRPPSPQLLQSKSAASPSPRHSAPFTPSHGCHGYKIVPTGSDINGEKHPRLQTIADGGSKVVQEPLEYITNELIDGKLVNTVEGLKVYEGLIHMVDIAKIIDFANKTKAYFRQGGLTGQTVVLGRRPLRYHGSLSIQLGVPMIEGLLDESQREKKVEAVPELLQGLFDHFFDQGIIPSKPDYCVIDFYDEEEYSHPQQYPPWYGIPLCILCLTDCDMVFGQVILGERGNSRGPLKLSLCTGSLIVLQGRSADVAKRCIPATSKQRILLTFGKSVPRKLAPEVDAITPASSVLPAPRAGLHLIPRRVHAAATSMPFPAAAPWQMQSQLVSQMLPLGPRLAPPRLPVPDMVLDPWHAQKMEPTLQRFYEASGGAFPPNGESVMRVSLLSPVGVMSGAPYPYLATPAPVTPGSFDTKTATSPPPPTWNAWATPLKIGARPASETRAALLEIYNAHRPGAGV